MADEAKRPLKVFLCHASGDKTTVRELYRRLVAEGVDAWLDQEKLMPGQDWQLEIPRAVREADVVVVCLSNRSITKEGYIQKEIKFALDSADEKPEGTIFLIPARLENCVVPEGLDRWQWVDLFEDNGFLKLLRSLKLRADKVGASIEPVSYEGEDKEIEKRLEQLYTDGLAAFYTEDWDRAYRRFQAILRERPSHKNAAERLMQSERQRDLAKLYAQATEAYQLENWLVAIKALEELLAKSGDYKDAVQLLRTAKKQNQLKELYAEVKTLHAAEKWQAVVRVFEQISAIEPDYPDPEGLLISAQKEVAELKRLDELNELYSQGVLEMDVGQWYEARRLLEQVHKAQTGFHETERLLRKIEHEITKIEELEKRNIQVNTLYEQAHGLVRSKNWREALHKIEDIQRLDNQFQDKDRIAEKAKTALELEGQEILKQNQLAAKYAEAVRLLKEGKYQEALDKWQEIKTIEPKYPDRQSVQRIARKNLADVINIRHPSRKKDKSAIFRSSWFRTLGIIIIVVVIGAIIWSVTRNLSVEESQNPTQVASPLAEPSSPVPPVSGDADPTFYEGFDDPVWDGKINSSLWIKRDNCGSVSQQNGSMVFKNSNKGCDLIVTQPRRVRGEDLGALEAKLMIDDDHQGGVVTQEIDFFTYELPGGLWWSYCGIRANDSNVSIIFNVENPGKKTADLQKSIPAKSNQWYVFRMEVDPQTMTFSCQVDGETIGSVIPKDVETLRNAQFERLTEGARWSGASGTSYVDYIQILP